MKYIIAFVLASITMFAQANTKSIPINIGGNTIMREVTELTATRHSVMCVTPMDFVEMFETESREVAQGLLDKGRCKRIAKGAKMWYTAQDPFFYTLEIIEDGKFYYTGTYTIGH